MTILFFTRFYYPHIGGVEKHIANVASELRKQKIDVVVVTEQHEPKLRKRENSNGVRVYRMQVGKDSKEKKYRIWQWLFEHRHLIEKADVVHCHDVFFWYLPFRIIYPRKKVFITFHGYEGDKVPQRRARLHHQLASFLSSGNISVGAYIPKWYQTKASMITYGAVSKVVPSKQRQQNEIVFVGRLAPETAILRYLQVFRVIHERLPSLQLTVVGDGPQRAEAEEYTQEHNLPVVFHGMVPNTASYLKNATCVFSSRYLSTLEAFSQKRFVFCLYNNAIHRDCFALSPFRHLMVYTDAEEQLVDAVVEFLQDKERRQRQIDLAYAWVKQQSWKKLADHYVTLWKHHGK